MPSQRKTPPAIQRMIIVDAGPLTGGRRLQAHNRRTMLIMDVLIMTLLPANCVRHDGCCSGYTGFVPSDGPIQIAVPGVDRGRWSEMPRPLAPARCHD